MTAPSKSLPADIDPFVADPQLKELADALDASIDDWFWRDVQRFFARLSPEDKDGADT